MDYSNYIKEIIYIQSYYKGYLYRKHHLPNSLLYIQLILSTIDIELSENKKDGRINSAYDEDIIYDILKDKLPNRIFKIKDRHWFDFYVIDYLYGKLPVNIKITTTTTNDNVGNLSILLYSLTNYDMILEKSYNNGKMVDILIEYLEKRKINNSLKKDYYFLIINKNDTSKIYVNSLKGINNFIPNKYNLPFQIKWKDNLLFNYHTTIEQINNIKMIVNSYTNDDWKTKFINGFQKI